MKQLSVMLKPASSLCNMRCKYCFYADVSSLRDVSSYGLMKESDAIIANIFRDLERGDILTLAFQGGEPTLAGLPFFQHFVQQVSRYESLGVRVSYALQTNGLLLDDAWCAFLKKHGFLVGLSIDGPSAYHDANRLDDTRKGTFRRVLEVKQRLDHFGIEYNVLMTLTKTLARHPQQVWRFMEEQDLHFVQMTPCMGPMNQAETPYALTPERYASFYIALFDLWYQSYQKGIYRSVKLFDDLVNLLAVGQCNACGLVGSCQTQIVVEADGGVYPCDFYVLDEWRVGNLCQESLRQVWDQAQKSGFLTREREPLALCQQCPYRSMCGGGCRRMRREVYYAPGAAACGHRIFLDAVIDRLRQLAALHQRRP